MPKLRRRVRTNQQSEQLRGMRRCEARHPMYHTVRCERMESQHVSHHADGYTFEWVQALPIRPEPETRF